MVFGEDILGHVVIAALRRYDGIIYPEPCVHSSGGAGIDNGRYAETVDQNLCGDRRIDFANPGNHGRNLRAVDFPLVKLQHRLFRCFDALDLRKKWGKFPFRGTYDPDFHGQISVNLM